MPIDPYIGVNIAGAYQQQQQNQIALEQARQAQRNQNTLQQILAQPGAVDTTTGQVSPNALAQIMKVSAPDALALIQGQAAAQQKRAEVAHLESETNKDQQEADSDFLSGAVGQYDAALQGGGTSPDIALSQLRQSVRDHIYSRPYSQAKNDADWAQVANATPAQLRALSMTAQQRLEAGKVAPYFDPKTGQTVFVGTERGEGGGVEVTDQSGQPATVEGPITKSGSTGQPKPQLLQDADGTDYWAFPPSAQGGKPTYVDMNGKPYEPKSAAHIAGGAPRSAAAMAAQRFEQDFAKKYGRQPTGDEIAQFSAGYNATVQAGTSSVHADAGSLTNITKIADASEAFEHTAMSNFETALSLAPKGIKTDMGPLIERWVQDPAKALGDPGVPSYQAALLTAANEYAKVIAGSTGSQGSTVDSRREAAEMFSSLYNTDQIEGVINVAKRDMDNKIASYAGQREAIKDRISGENPGALGGSSAGSGGDGKHAAAPAGGLAHPTSKQDYDALPSGAHYTKPGDAPGTYRVKP